MTIYDVMAYIKLYGLFFLFLIVTLEYLNLPGLPSGIIMPAAGIMIQSNDMSFFEALFVSVIGGLVGSFILYAIGFYLGKPILDKLYSKYKKMRPSIDKVTGFPERHGDKGIFIARLIPVARTLISLSAGTVRMELVPFTIYSAFGITVWNFVYIYAGYAFGHLFLK
ncbi:MAG: DedA family protein [Turicibacter sp.]